LATAIGGGNAKNPNRRILTFCPDQFAVKLGATPTGIFVTEPKKRSLAGIAGIVAIATLISKVFGLVRQQAIAAAFGLGIAYGAYNFSYVIPGFLLILLGGINGPFHSAIVSVVSKRKREDIAPLVESITTLVGGILLVVTLLLILFAAPLTDLLAPGLALTPDEALVRGISPENLANLRQMREIAIQQLQIMAPMALLAGLIGIGFGTLNAADTYWLPSVSPLFSSITVLIGIAWMVWYTNGQLLDPKYAMLGGLVLAWSTLAGAVLQWLVQVPAQWKAGLGTLRLRFNFNQPGVKEVMQIMLPATFSSGMMQINVWTTLFFASFLANADEAVSALGYSGLLVQTPLGIMSNVILVPFLPIFARLAAPENWGELKLRIRQSLMMTALTMLPMGALMMALAFPMVRLVYERFAFDRQDSTVVTEVLIAYAVGMFVYLARDVLVRVFYALGDGATPFYISLVNIVVNVVLCAVLIESFGAPGMVLATFGVNLVATFAMIWILNQRLHGLPLWEWTIAITQVTVLSFLAGVGAYGVLKLLEQVMGSEGLLVHAVQLAIAGLAGLGLFGAMLPLLKLPETDLFLERVRLKFKRN